ncbi:hypothetical protein Ahia01_000944200 [Argonauta hians]
MEYTEEEMFKNDLWIIKLSEMLYNEEDVISLIEECDPEQTFGNASTKYFSDVMKKWSQSFVEDIKTKLIELLQELDLNYIADKFERNDYSAESL